MMWVLPVASALSVTCFISHGDRNCPFLMLTALPALATFWMKSVCRHRNAGVCSTSTTAVTSSSGVYSCTSVSTGTPSWRLTSLSTLSPSSRPGPRNAVPEVRLALSKLDLKMKGMPSEPVISFSCPATSSCNCIDSITHGPAIRKNGRSRPMSNPQSFMGSSRSGRDNAGEPRLRGDSRARLAQGRDRRQGFRLVVARGAEEADEQRMAIARRRQEFRVRLAGQEPRVLVARQLDHLHQQVVHRLGGNHQAGVLELRAVAVVELVAVAVALGDDVLAVKLARQRAWLEPLGLHAQAHRAAQVAVGIAPLDLAGGGAPLGAHA